MTKKSKLVLGLASMLGITAGATAVSGFAWFTTTKGATVSVTNIGVYSKSSALAVTFKEGTRCTGTNVAAGINVIGDHAASTTTQVITANATQASTKKFAVDKHPYKDGGATVTIKSGSSEPVNATVTDIDEESREITLSNTILEGDIVTITYTPYEAMTDVSSYDGQTFYKPTWTATGEGHYATAIPTTDTGYVTFTMTLSATGASGLIVYANSGVTITPADGENAHDVAAAGITRVAVIDDNSSTTKFVTQNATSAGTVGINSTWAGNDHKNWDSDGDHTNDGWNLKAADSTAIPTITNLVQANAIADKSAHDAAWAASNQLYTDGYITTIPAGGSRDVTVAIWLEGTNNTDSEGKFNADPEKGMIGVTLPLIAF